MQAKAKAATFSDTLSDVEDEALIDTLADMYRWRRPEIIHVTLGDVQAQALFQHAGRHPTKDGGIDTLQQTELSEGRRTGRNAGLKASRVKGQDNLPQTGQYRDGATRRHGGWHTTICKFNGVDAFCYND